MSAPRIRLLTGTLNGTNKVFTAPDEFVAGSFRIIWNGIIYDPTDTAFGYAETGTNQITTTNAPTSTDVLQGFYEPLTSVGSPQHPTGLVP